MHNVRPSIGIQSIVNMHVVRRRLPRTVIRQNAGNCRVSVSRPKSRNISGSWEWSQVEGRKIWGDGCHSGGSCHPEIMGELALAQFKWVEV